MPHPRLRQPFLLDMGHDFGYFGWHFPGFSVGLAGSRAWSCIWTIGRATEGRFKPGSTVDPMVPSCKTTLGTGAHRSDPFKEGRGFLGTLLNIF